MEIVVLVSSLIVPLFVILFMIHISNQWKQEKKNDAELMDLMRTNIDNKNKTISTLREMVKI